MLPGYMPDRSGPSTPWRDSNHPSEDLKVHVSVSPSCRGQRGLLTEGCLGQNMECLELPWLYAEPRSRLDTALLLLLMLRLFRSCRIRVLTVYSAVRFLARGRSVAALHNDFRLRARGFQRATLGKTKLKAKFRGKRRIFHELKPLNIDKKSKNAGT